MRHSEIGSILDSPGGDVQSLALRGQEGTEASADGDPAMIFQCDDLERALRSPELMPDARAHAETCERAGRSCTCGRRSRGVAPQLHQEWESPGLWTRIRGRNWRRPGGRAGHPHLALGGWPRRPSSFWRPFCCSRGSPCAVRHNRDFLTEEHLAPSAAGRSRLRPVDRPAVDRWRRQPGALAHAAGGRIPREAHGARFGDRGP